MQADIALIRKALSKDLMEILIRFSLIAFLVVMSVKIFSPFLALMLWAVILAVTLYPLHQHVAKRLGGKQGGGYCGGGVRTVVDRRSHRDAWRLYCRFLP